MCAAMNREVPENWRFVREELKNTKIKPEIYNRVLSLTEWDGRKTNAKAQKITRKGDVHSGGQEEKKDSPEEDQKEGSAMGLWEAV